MEQPPNGLLAIAGAAVADLVDSEGDLPAPVDELAEWLVQVRRMRRHLGDLESVIERQLYHKMPEKEYTSPVGLLVKRRNVRKRWDHEALLHRALQAADERRVDENGEVLMDRVGAYMQVLQDWMSPGYWRVGALSKDGLDADEYCEVEIGQPKIQLK